MATLTTTHCDWCFRDVTDRNPKFKSEVTIQGLGSTLGQKLPSTTDSICGECTDSLRASVRKLRDGRYRPERVDRVEPESVPGH